MTIILKRITFLSVFSLILISPIAKAYGPFNLPPGNYQKTCNACSMSFGALNCMCNDRQGFPTNTTLNVPRRCRFVENINGQLRCTRWQHRRHRYRRRSKRLFKAGPIWDQNDAENKCPAVCYQHNRVWTGQWNTIANGRMSVCQCRWEDN